PAVYFASSSRCHGLRGHFVQALDQFANDQKSNVTASIQDWAPTLLCRTRFVIRSIRLGIGAPAWFVQPRSSGCERRLSARRRIGRAAIGRTLGKPTPPLLNLCAKPSCSPSIKHRICRQRQAWWTILCWVAFWC